VGIKYTNKEMGGVLGGGPLELVVEDDAGTPSESIAGYRKTKPIPTGERFIGIGG
jgi:hypothetical protein